MKEESRNKRKAGRKKDPYPAKPVSVPVPLIPVVKSVIKKFKDQVSSNPNLLNNEQEVDVDYVGELECQNKSHLSHLSQISQTLLEILEEFSCLRKHISKQNHSSGDLLGDFKCKDSCAKSSVIKEL